MDLGLTGRWALVCGASKGLGRACAEALVREGADVVIVARGAEALAAAADELRALCAGAQVRPVAADVTTPEGRAAALAALPQVDILVTNAGGPRPQVTSASGIVTPGCVRWTPTCSPRSS